MKLIEKLQLISNDYTELEKQFKLDTKLNLVDTANFPGNDYLSVSIIIPCFNSENTIEYVLDSILQQTYKGDIEVILIDDASSYFLIDKIKKFETSLTIKYIRNSKNQGRGKSRELGILLAQNELIVSIDSDIILPPDFISNHTFAHKNSLEDIIAVSFREDVNTISDDLFSRTPTPETSDHRLYMKYAEDQIMKDEDRNLVGKEFKLVEDTDYFKEFGHNRTVEVWTLPLMVLSCSMSVKRDWSQRFWLTEKGLHGWGFDDTCVAAKMIAQDKKVIPLVNSSVYHYLEKEHTLSNDIKKSDFLKNEIIYQKLLNSDIEPI